MESAEIASWLTGLGTIFLGIVAAFKDQIVSYFIKPRINISLVMRPPDCILTTWTIDEFGMRVPTYYFRFRVLNNGSQNGEQLEVFASQLSKKENDQFKKIDSFEPMRLCWSYINQPILDRLPAKTKTGRFCDLGYVVFPKNRTNPTYARRPPFFAENLDFNQSDRTLLHLRMEKMSDYKSYLLKEGTYTVVIEISGKNVEPIEKTLEIYISGEWFDDEKKMFKEGITAKVR